MVNFMLALIFRANMRANMKLTNVLLYTQCITIVYKIIMCPASHHVIPNNTANCLILT